MAVSLALSTAAESSTRADFFEKQIRPLLIAECYECHSQESGKAKGGLVLDTKAGWEVGGDSGPTITPGDPDDSLLMQAVSYQSQDLQMPPKTRLTDEEIASLHRWVADGAFDPRDSEPAQPAHTAPTGLSLEAGRQFHSFRRLSLPKIPEPSDPTLARNPIDHFLLSRLDEHQITPAPLADRRTLIRRAFIDLIGLPPLVQQLDHYSSLPDYYPLLIDDLLDSPRYGERWGRHWLDVARYADSNGLDENHTYGQAWRYRDYVIDSFNRDKPFDQFLIEQLAGDLIEYSNNETKTGTGFLALGGRLLAERDMAKLEMDVIDEQIDSTGKAFLGLTLGCARCHDHKFDPITQADYYSLAAIFKSTENFTTTDTGNKRHWYEHAIGTPAEIAKHSAIDTEIKELRRAAANYKQKQTVKLRVAARERATDYLLACLDLPFDATLSDARAVAEPLDLHPRILHHARTHLEYRRDDLAVTHWHHFAAQQDREGLVTFYTKKFAQAIDAYSKARKNNPKAQRLDDPELEAYRIAYYDTAGLLAVPTKPSHAFDKETLAEYETLRLKAIDFESQAYDAPAIMGVSEAAETVDEIPIAIRGSHTNLGKSVAKAVPAVFHKTTTFSSGRSGRLELAKWMTQLDSALAAKVYVNRVWAWHFGTGLVDTPDNFGVLGRAPSHPELLDWLTHWFIDSGWSTKSLHKLIMQSRFYQHSSHHPAAQPLSELDPENRWLAYYPTRRLQAEAIRDSILHVSGRLDLTQGGKTLQLRNRQIVFDHTSVDRAQYGSTRRSVYLPVVRNHLCSLFEQFDFPDPTMVTGQRNITTVAPQALYLMNSEMVTRSAETLAKQVIEEHATLSIDKRVDHIYHSVLGRSPIPDELKLAKTFLTAADNLETWTLFCQSLLMSNEFLYLN